MKKHSFIMAADLLVLSFVISTLAIQALPDDWPRKSDGIVILNGSVQAARTNNEELSFSFTGKFHFSFFTAPQEDLGRKRIDLEFAVQKLSVTIPKFEATVNQRRDDPFIVSYGNAVRHALEASNSGEPVDIALFRPKLSYGIGGTLERIECTHGQVLPDRLVKQIHGAQQP